VAYTLLAAIVLVNVLGALYWIDRNVVLVGHDSTKYLETTFTIAQFLSPLSPLTFFKALTFDHYRTPALYLAAQPFLLWFGHDMDGAQMLNVVMLALTIGLTYALGTTLADRAAGLFAAALVGLLPMTAAMGRLYYTEAFLTAMVALNLLALYRCRSFTRRRWSVLWGVSLGIGLLVKWTMPMYVGLPLLWVIWDADLVQQQVRAVRPPRVRWGAVAGALAGAAALTTAWFWLIRSEVSSLPAGNFMAAGWCMLLALLLYAALQRSSPLANAWLALWLAVLIASLWYLPYADFATRLLEIDQERGAEAASPLALDNYLRNFRYLYSDHFGALAFWLIVPVALLPWLRAWWQRRTLTRQAMVLWLSLLSAFVVLSLISQRNQRNLAPLLPAGAVLATLGLWHYPRLPRRVLGALWIGVLALQWSFFTFDALTPFYRQTRPLWAADAYAKAPATGDTDPGYWIGPDVLAEVLSGDGPMQYLAVLVNTDTLHRGMFRYLVAAGNAPVTVLDPTAQGSAGWGDLWSSQWVLVKDGNNANVEGPGQAIIQRVLAGDPLFRALYQEVKAYSLPNGETATLYHRTRGPAKPDTWPEAYASAKVVADAMRAAGSASATVLFPTADRVPWIAVHNPDFAHFRILEDDPRPWAERLAPLEGTVLVVLDADTAALQAYLDEHAYRTAEVGDAFMSMGIYGMGAGPLAVVEVHASWPDAHITQMRSLAQIAPGQVLPIDLNATIATDRPLKLSARLVAPDGTVVTTHDRPLTTTDRFGLFVPPTVPPGAYSVVMILYDPDTLETVATNDGSLAATLMPVQVVP